MDLDYIKDIIKEQLRENKKSVLFYESSAIFAKFIAEQKDLTDNKDFNFSAMPVQESERIASAFFQYFNQELYQEYLNNRNYKRRFLSQANLEEERKFYLDLMHEKLLMGLISDGDYAYAEEYYNNLVAKKSICIDDNGRVTITLMDDSRDIYSIVHENIHKFFIQPWGFQEKFNMSFLFEVPSITGELILSDYLSQNGYQEEAQKYMQNRFSDLKEWSVWFIFYKMLFDIYLKKHRLSMPLIDSEIDKLEEPIRSKIQENKEMLLKRFMKSFGSIYFMLHRYIMGIMLACYVKEHIKNDPNLLFQLGKDIYEDDLLSALKLLNAPYINENLKINPDVIKAMFNSYQNEYQKYQSTKGLNL